MGYISVMWYVKESGSAKEKYVKLQKREYTKNFVKRDVKNSFNSIK